MEVLKPTAAELAADRLEQAPRQKLLASVDLFAEDIVLTQYDPPEGGAVKRQYIDAEQIVAILRKADAGGKAKALLPMFPGVLAAGPLAKGEARWIVLRPAGRSAYQVTVAGKVRTVRLIHCPALVAELHGKPGKGGVRWTHLVRLFAVGGNGMKPPAPDDRVYLPPIGDVTENGGLHLCGVEWEKMTGMSALEALEATIFRSRFTGASLDVALSAAGRGRYRNVLELAAARKIDLAMLKEVGSYAKAFY